MSVTSFWCLYCYFLTDFTHCSGVSIIDNFEQVNGSCPATIYLFKVNNRNTRKRVGYDLKLAFTNHFKLIFTYSKSAVNITYTNIIYYIYYIYIQYHESRSGLVVIPKLKLDL